MTLSGLDDSSSLKFTKMIYTGSKRIYMTATPRLYSDDSQSKHLERMQFYVPWMMRHFTEMSFRMGFGGQIMDLTDYKVLVLTLNEGDVPKQIQDVILGQPMRSIQMMPLS